MRGHGAVALRSHARANMKSTAVELDHISVPVRRYREARRFYEAALGAILQAAA